MLFPSFEFIFLFLPTALAGFYLGIRYRREAALAWLSLASLFFYGWWNPAYVGLLLASIAFNFWAGVWIARLSPGTRARKAVLLGAIASDLLLLGYYKYTHFFLDTVNGFAGTDWNLGQIILPLGISFFTFTQIAYLVDAYRDRAREYRFIPYLLFVTYFPHLIAGPILHHAEMMPQFERTPSRRCLADDLAVGLTIFFFGLFKKTVLADGIAPHAQHFFETAAQGAEPRFPESWIGALTYTFQLYFDFSGYSDMAIGLSLLFGIRLPINFDSPYRAVDIIDFWRRWHMTLSRFLRDYLYIPLGGNRCPGWRRNCNLFVTMLLGGLWHGANWTFVAWGALHGVYLVLAHTWRSLRLRLGLGPQARSEGGRMLARTVTFVAVVFAWVIFRADSLATATRVWQGMLGINGYAPLPQEPAPLLWVLSSLLICMLLPNTLQLFARFRPALDTLVESLPPHRFWHWRPAPAWALGSAIVAVVAVLSISELSEFIYFQF
jgi:D-alanyl-lipoteichoic acid acyltransferase DltB (MBOAT superfamily)